MFYWDNSYYIDLCTKNINMKFDTYPTEFITTKQQLIKNELCKYTSSYFREEVKSSLMLDFEINVEQVLAETPEVAATDLIIEADTQFIKPIVVDIINNNNEKEVWRYTKNDAWLGLACQNKLENNDINNQIKESMNIFKQDDILWDQTYAKAYKKMINNNVRWFKSKTDGFKITGNECKSGFKYYNNKKICKTAFLPNESFYY